MAITNLAPRLSGSSCLRQSAESSSAGLAAGVQSFSPPVGFQEDDTEVRFSFCVPGVQKSSDWHVSVEDGRYLCISGVRRTRFDADGTTRKRARFSRRIPLGDAVDVSTLHAHFSPDVLVVTASRESHVVSPSMQNHGLATGYE